MLKFTTTPDANGRQMLGIGLSYRNLEKLKDDKPILVQAGALGMEDFTGIDRVAIFAAPTEELLEAQLHSFAGFADATRTPTTVPEHSEKGVRSGKLYIGEIFVFVCKDDKGDEGVPAFQAPLGMMPLIAADRARLSDLKPIAKMLTIAAGRKITLCRFTGREELEVIG